MLSKELWKEYEAWLYEFRTVIDSQTACVPIIGQYILVISGVDRQPAIPLEYELCIDSL